MYPYTECSLFGQLQILVLKYAPEIMKIYLKTECQNGN